VPPTGVKPGALTDLLRQVAAVPETREAAPAPLLAGAVIGRFEIVRELGRGGFGVVYEARDRELGRQVALKLVRHGAAAAEAGKVAREAEAIARLAHPNLITLYEVGRSDHGPYLVFELLRGKTLQERIDDGPLPLQEAVHIAVEVARGLAHAHAEGVVHRDLKPSNVFVTFKGQVKILDFGMAHAFGRRRLSGGTPAYMAPEQWTDEPEDERTDVFALGVMLHVMLSGEYPFPEGDGRWSAGATTAPKLDLPGAPGLADLSDRMLEKAPKGRPRDGAAVLAALAPIEESLRSKPADGAPPGHVKRRRATLGDLVAELKRRRVFRVMVGYGIFAFAALLVTEPIMHGAHLPAWVLTAAPAALAVGFPVAVILAWVFDLTVEGVRRTPSVTGSAGIPISSGRMVALLVAVALVAATPVGAWYLWKQIGERVPGQTATQVATSDGRIVVAVADFTNDTGERQLNALTGLLVTSLEQSKRLLLLSRGRMLDVARHAGLPSEAVDEVTGRSAGRGAGAAFLLIPAVHKLGATYVVELRALDLAMDQYRFTVKETAARQEELISLIDRLSDRTRQELHETPAEVAGARVELGKALTRSLEAYQHYLKGREVRLRQCDSLAAEKEQRRALELDPGFGAAHMELGVLVLNNGGSMEESTAHFQVARKLTASLPEKERRIVELDALVTPTVPVPGDRQRQKDEVTKGLDELITRYPQDEYVFYWGGWAHNVFGEWEKALESYQRSLEIDPGQCHVVGYASYLLGRLDRVGERVALLRRAVEARPNAANRSMLARELAALKPEEATHQAREALRLATGGQAVHVWNAACALADVGLPAEAQAAARKLSLEGETAAMRSAGRDLVAILAAVKGRPQEAAAMLDMAVGGPDSPILNPRAALLAVGRSGHRAPLAVAELRQGPDVLLKSGELALFGDLKGAAEVAALLPRGSAAEVHYLAVRAVVERRWDEAIPALRPLLDGWKEAPVGAPVLDPRRAYRVEMPLLLAEALLETGRAADALEVLRPAEGFGLCGVQQAAHVPNMIVARALAYERLGRPADALKELDRLITLWKDAEPGLPLLTEARATRARLAAAPR
jgi:tetratricopeptide (TPR) repeat protein